MAVPSGTGTNSEGLSGGYNTKLGTRSEGLSGGYNTKSGTNSEGLSGGYNTDSLRFIYVSLSKFVVVSQLKHT